MLNFSSHLNIPEEILSRGNKHRERYRTSEHDIDFNGVVRPSILLRYMQETNFLQHVNNPPTLAELREKRGRAFILSRLTMKMYKPLHSQDEIDVDAWLAPIKSTSLDRYDQIFRGDELIAEMASFWALVDVRSKKLVRPEVEDMGFGFSDPLELEVKRLRIPRGLEMEPVGRYHVGWSLIDVNRHMNNTYYPDMFLDFMPKGSLDGRTVTEMTIAYDREAPYGEDLIIRRASNGSLMNTASQSDSAVPTETVFFTAEREDGNVCTEASFTIGKL